LLARIFRWKRSASETREEPREPAQQTLDDAAIYSEIRAIPVRRMNPCVECGCSFSSPVVRGERGAARLHVIGLQCCDCGRSPGGNHSG
jgi:hypothetical protein